MILTAILFSISVAQQQPIPISKQVCPEPTGKNGYEDYLYAADISNSQEYRNFGSWEIYVADLARGGSWPKKDEDGKDLPIPKAPGRLTSSSSQLDLRRTKAKQFDRILELVRAGNQKPCFYPKEEIDNLTVFPELVHFKTIAKFIVTSAYVSFAEGRTSEGTEKLFSGLEFAQQIADGPLISDLVAIASRAIIFAQFEEALPQLSVLDCQRIIQSTKALLKRPPPYAKAIDWERKSTLSAFDRIGKNPEKAIEELGGEIDSQNAGFTALAGFAPEKRMAAIQTAKTAISVQYQSMIDRVNGPESRWIKPVKEERGFEHPAEKEWSPEDVGMMMVSIFTPVFSQALTVEARSRTQLRLLLLNARVLEYRWLNAALPKKLADAAPIDELKDPFSGIEFKYELQGRNGYRLYSKGFGDGGEIELRYRRPQVPDSPLRDDGDNPPPRIKPLSS